MLVRRHIAFLKQMESDKLVFGLEPRVNDNYIYPGELILLAGLEKLKNSMLYYTERTGGRY